jgi:hypothetical protein
MGCRRFVISVIFRVNTFLPFLTEDFYTVYCSSCRLVDEHLTYSIYCMFSQIHLSLNKVCSLFMHCIAVGDNEEETASSCHSTPAP